MTNQHSRVGGVGSHKDTIHVAVTTSIGESVADHEFATAVTRAVIAVVEVNRTRGQPDPTCRRK